MKNQILKIINFAALAEEMGVTPEALEEQAGRVIDQSIQVYAASAFPFFATAEAGRVYLQFSAFGCDFLISAVKTKSKQDAAHAD